MSDPDDMTYMDTQPWWERSGEDQTTTLVSLIRELREDDGGRLVRYRVWDDLYDGTAFLAYGQPLGQSAYQALSDSLGDTSFNYAARALDFVHAKITAELPSVRAAGHDADHEQYLRAKALSRFIVGACDATKLQAHLSEAVKCCLRVGTGAISVEYDAEGTPSLEDVHPRELFVDPDDARHGNPRCLYRIRPTDRRSLLERFPDRADVIITAGTTDDVGSFASRPYDWTASRRASESADLYEAWVLPAGDGSPGLHVQCLESGEPLMVETWEDDAFPISLIRAWKATTGTGFWGRGLIERLDSAQFSIDELVRHVDESMRHANLKVFLSDDSDIVADGILDDPTVGTIIRTSGPGVPAFVTPEVLGPGREVMAVIAEWRSSLYQIAGLDESAVSSQRPAGVDSAIAIRTYHDFQSQGYVDLMRRIGDLAVDTVRSMIDAARRHFSGPEGDREWSVRYAKGGSGVTVSWSEVDMPRDSFVIELEETSPTPDTRSGRLQELEEDAAAGRIPPDYMTRLREDPDRWWADRLNAQEDVDYVDWLVDELMDESKPMPMLMDEMDGQMAIDRLRREVLASVRMGRPSGVIQRLQEFASRVVDSMTALQAQQQIPASAPMGAAPQAPPADAGMHPAPPMGQ